MGQNRGEVKKRTRFLGWVVDYASNRFEPNRGDFAFEKSMPFWTCSFLEFFVVENRKSALDHGGSGALSPTKIYRN